ncbi:MAG: response regulator [Deltaproteobacteria bacterium]|nr:response regulator [Deltaproteobacteria bacterium]
MSEGARILVVDDERAVREAVVDFLEDEGYGVASAACGADALELARAERFALCILDLRMPGMSGTELALELRALAPSTPLLIITGSPDFVPGKSLRAVGIGADDTLVKPYELATLAEKVRHRLGGEGAS